ncbi:MAG: ribosomal RNA small subunit methyltransferase G [Chitinophagales bacterium]|nr:MAG: ribosomal RNA small subunit methyltransferase G [Chitinophagales bacterium]
MITTSGTSELAAPVFKYFPQLTARQKEQMELLQPLYSEWNDKINVISRKDIDNLYTHHVLHSLSIARVIQFKSGTKILDIGTGGGFPGIPLAILFPEARFHLVDSVKKKIMVVEAVTHALELKNVTAEWNRVENISGSYHFVVSRAVSYLKTLYTWSRNKLSNEHFNDLKNGLLSLKGGDILDEIEALKLSISDNQPYIQTYAIHDFFKEEYFLDKWIVYVEG